MPLENLRIREVYFEINKTENRRSIVRIKASVLLRKMSEI